MYCTVLVVLFSKSRSKIGLAQLSELVKDLGHAHHPAATVATALRENTLNLRQVYAPAENTAETDADPGRRRSSRRGSSRITPGASRPS